jgi:predicted RecA/RadA family phage recombinase
MADPVSKLIHPCGEAKVTAAKAYESGEPVKLADGKTGVYTALRPAASGDLMVVETKGVREFPCATGVTFAVGAEVHWHIANKTVVAAADGANTFSLGNAFVAKTAGQLVCLVDIETSQGNSIADTKIDAIP